LAKLFSKKPKKFVPPPEWLGLAKKLGIDPVRFQSKSTRKFFIEFFQDARNILTAPAADYIPECFRPRPGSVGQSQVNNRNFYEPKKG
jgi:hypothetical protein